MTTTVPVVPAAGSTLPERAERGTTTIADSVVAKLAAIAVRHVEGVAGMGGALSGTMGQVVGRIRGREHATGGVGVEVGQTQAAVDLTVRLHYPVAVHELAEEIRRSVADHIRRLTGLEVVEVNIAVIDLLFPEDEDETGEPERVR